MESFFGGLVGLHEGDCREAIKSLADCSVESCVTDGPYVLDSIRKRFGKPGSAPARGGVFRRSSRGFMNQGWDTGDTVFSAEFWAEVLRVLKPGGYLLAFGGTRTYHRMAVAIEDAGFEIRDQIGWAFGSGHPKALDVAKAIDKAKGGKGTYERLDHPGRPGTRKRRTPIIGQANSATDENPDGLRMIYRPETVEAQDWQGWATALKPAWEPICMARKPIEGTVAANVLKWGVGALNIRGCRIPATDKTPFPAGAFSLDGVVETGFHNRPRTGDSAPDGRWPANMIHDGSDEVVAAFPDTMPSRSGNKGMDTGIQGGNWAAGKHALIDKFSGFDDAGGSAARFFYTAKADSDDRLGSMHPTVKPVDLIQYLIRLVTPTGGLCLDPFAGTGTAGEAAMRENVRAILIEREPKYCDDIRRRMALTLASTAARKSAATRPDGEAAPRDETPDFFGG